MGNPSPLRYPGGKYKISKLIELLVNKSGDNCSVYVEPFAGGAGIAIDLLLRDVVSEIVINDSDPAICSGGLLSRRTMHLLICFIVLPSHLMNGRSNERFTWRGRNTHWNMALRLSF